MASTKRGPPTKRVLSEIEIDTSGFCFQEIAGEPPGERRARRKREYARWTYRERQRVYQEQLAAELGLPEHETAAAVAGEAAAGIFIGWCATALTVPPGAPRAGKRFELAEWQQAFIRDAMAPTCYAAGLSVARKNGKSALIAAWLLCHLAGPLARAGWRASCVSLSSNHAKELRDAIESLASTSNLQGFLKIRVTPHPGSITGRYGSRVDFLSTDVGTGHAIASDLAIIDEAGLFLESDRALWNQVLGSLAGRDGRLVAISVRGRGPMFSELAESSGADGYVWHEHAHQGGGRIDDDAALRAANPGIEQGIVSMRWLRHTAAGAIRNIGDRANFRTYHLNQRTRSIGGTFVTPDAWALCASRTIPDRGCVCFVGIDVGDSVSGSAIAFYWPDSGRLTVRVWLVAPGEDLEARGRADGVGAAYEAMQAEGTLTAVEHAPSGQLLAHAVRTELEACQPDRGVGVRPYAAAIGADTYKLSTIENELRKVVNMHKFESRGASTGQESDIRAFETAFHNQELRYHNTKLMAEALSGVSREFRDGAAYLAKAWDRALTDPVHAAIIAVGLAGRYPGIREASPYLGMF